MDAEAERVREYYNDFLLKRMIGYRLNGNMRIDAARKFFCNHANEDSTIVDVGCGIGIISEALGRVATRGQVLGVDISDQNVWYARKTVDLPNVDFRSVDVIREASTIPPLLNGKSVDLFTLADVVEHIPEQDRPRLFDILSSLSSPDAKVLITIPSEFYQRYLMQENPDELQIIDNIITPTILAEEGRAAGFSMSYFRLVDMWAGVQYAHCVLEKTAALQQRVRETVTQPSNAMLYFGRRLADKVYLRARRRRRYVTDVFPTSG